LRLFTFLKPPFTNLFLFLGNVVKGGPNLEDLRIILFAGVFVQVLLMVDAFVSVFWVVIVVGAGDVSGFPARVADRGVAMSYKDSNALLTLIF